MNLLFCINKLQDESKYFASVNSSEHACTFFPALSAVSLFQCAFEQSAMLG